MELFKHDANVNFMGIRRFSVMVSLLLMVASIVSLATRGLNFSLDFTGGTLVEVRYESAPVLDTVRGKLADAGYAGAMVQTFGSSRDLVIRIAPAEGISPIEVGPKIIAALQAKGDTVILNRSESVGPQVGRELAEDGLVAIVVVIIGLLAYVAARFQWKFAVAGITAEIHDTLITIGCISFFRVEVDLTVLAAVLAVIGYSINDKVVVFDRIREMFRGSGKLSPIETLNKAINTTLSRTTMTSFTTSLAVISLLVFGGPILWGFGVTLLIGIVVGTLSSILLACPILELLRVSKKDLMPRSRDITELERRP